MSRLAVLAFRCRPAREWAIPLALPGLLAVLGLGLWLLGLVTGPRRHGVLLGQNAFSFGLPSLYFLAWGLAAAREAAIRGRKDAALASAALAFGLMVLLFIALYPAPYTADANTSFRVLEAVPLGLVSWIGVSVGFIVGAFVTASFLAVVIPAGTLVSASMATILLLTLASVVGLLAAAVAGCVTGLALALVETRATGITGRLWGHMKWMAVAAMCVYASLRMPSLPLTLAVAMAGLAVHAYRMPARPLADETRGRGVPAVLCLIVAVYAAFVLLASGMGRVGSQYLLYVP